MIYFTGIHGTSASCAEKIRRDGFILSGPESFWGEGIYFFKKNFKKKSDGREAAEKWYYRKNKGNGYAEDDDKSFVAIYTEIEAERDCFLDISNKEFCEISEELEKYADELSKKKASDDEEKDHIKNYIRNQWLKQFEQRQGMRIKVFLCSVPYPKYPTTCIVAKDASCIKSYYIEGRHERKDTHQPQAGPC